MSIILIIYAIMTGLISAFEHECVNRVVNTQFSSFCYTIIALTVTCNKPSCSQKEIKKSKYGVEHWITKQFLFFVT